MFYIVYKTVNVVNGKEYIGKHATSNLLDGYIGSGVLLRKAITKYGKQNFKREILFCFDSEVEMNQKERELVTEEFCSNDSNYNLCPGGRGGFGYINRNSLKPKMTSDRAKQMASKRLDAENTDWRKDVSTRGGQSTFLKGVGIFAPGYEKPSTAGKPLTSEHKEKIGKANSLKQSGAGNSNFGKRWMHNKISGECASVPASEVDSRLKRGWVFGRKFHVCAN